MGGYNEELSDVIEMCTAHVVCGLGVGQFWRGDVGSLLFKMFSSILSKRQSVLSILLARSKDASVASRLSQRQLHILESTAGSWRKLTSPSTSMSIPGGHENARLLSMADCTWRRR